MNILIDKSIYSYYAYTSISISEQGNIMAFVTKGNGSGFWLAVSLMDSQNDISTLEYELTSADFATAQTDALSILAALGGVTQCIAVGYTISLRMVNDAIVYPTGADNSIRARIVAMLSDGTDKAVLEVPAPEDTVFIATTGEDANIVNLAAVNVSSYLDVFKAGGESYISDGERIDFGIKGRRVARAKRFS